MSATMRLSAGVYQVTGTNYVVMNDSRRCWWVAKIIDGIDSLDPADRFFIGGTRSDAIEYARELHMTAQIAR
jgi:hypothetical protein